MSIMVMPLSTDQIQQITQNNEVNIAPMGVAPWVGVAMKLDRYCAWTLVHFHRMVAE